MPRVSKEVAGISIGEPGDSRKPILMALEGHGITIKSGNVADWRAGRANPLFVGDQVAAARKLAKNNASDKDNAYLAIAEAGVEVRRLKIRSDLRKLGLYSSAGFTEELGSRVGIRAQSVREAIRSMRADLVFSAGQISESQRQIFLIAAEGYLDNYLQPGATNFPDKYRGFNQAWDRSIPHFYALLYEGNRARMIGTWTPYEMPVLRFFYQSRIAQGSRLSEYDKLVLKASVNRNQEVSSHVALAAEQKTGISFDSKVLAEHRNFLLYGQSINPVRAAIK